MKLSMKLIASTLVMASPFTVTPFAHAQAGAGFNAGAAQVPPQGTYDRYNGPGATVLQKTLEAQHEPGVAEELEPGAKQSATGGPSGGLPGRGGQ